MWIRSLAGFEGGGGNINQEMQAEAGKGKETDSPLELLEKKNHSADTLILGVTISRTIRS